MPTVRPLPTLLALAVCAVARPASAAVVEEVLNVPFERATVRQMMTVTLVRDDAIARAPFLVLLHGRPAEPAAFARLGRVDYPANARYFAALGFAVLVPTRVGYGVTGGPDLESTGTCVDKHVEAGTAAGVDEVRQLLAWAAKRPEIDATRGLLLGESFGGLVALAAGSLPGVRGVVSIAAGDGGDSLHRPDAPCAVDRVGSALRAFAGVTRVPTLWMYSRNDRFWGPTVPRRWFDAYRAGGGDASFVELPADKNNGHFIFTRNPPAWRPGFEEFARKRGFGTR